MRFPSEFSLILLALELCNPKMLITELHADEMCASSPHPDITIAKLTCTTKKLSPLI
jgi:hypothetical protein